MFRKYRDYLRLVSKRYFYRSQNKEEPIMTSSVMYERYQSGADP